MIFLQTMTKDWKYWLYQPYKWLVVIPIFGLATLLGAIYIIIMAPFSPNLSFYGGVMWAKVMQWVTPMPVIVKGRENIAKGQSYIIASNHQGAYDIFAIFGSLGLNFRWILKKELRKAPVLGYTCELMQNIFIDRSSKMAAYRSIQRAKEILRDGTSVMIFPEGTRSGSSELGPFKHGAFKLAYSLELPILPITLKDTHKVMCGGLSTLMPHRVELIIHEPINTMNFVDNQNGLVEATREAIASGL